MGMCSDRSVNYLKTLNLNVILHPQEGLKPMDLLGVYKDAPGILGRLDQLTEPHNHPLPEITSGVAANINGQRSSKLPIELGIGILGRILGAMGAQLDVALTYKQAQKIDFTYTDVTRHRANTMAIGDFLGAARIRWNHPVLKKYLFDSGKLYVITEIVTSRKIGVTAYRQDDTQLKLDIPVIREIAGGSIKIGSESETSTTVLYEGDTPLAFGFSAIELAAGERGDNGEIDLVLRPVKAGAVSYSLGGGQALVFADFEGALPTLSREDPAALDEQ
jgi:hypothetical protein